MTPHDEPDSQPDHRAYYRASGDEIEVREDLDGDDGMFEIRMPIMSTGEVRNEGDDPFTSEEMEGMARQVADTDTGVFPEHGKSDRIDRERYSQFERLGNWAEGEVESRESEDLLMATARLADPETLPAATGSYRESLAILKEQAKRGIGINSSIGWREDDSFPGGNDLMEASIVGIGADWRTNTTDEEAEVLAHAAIEAGADPDRLLASVRSAVASERPLGPPDDPERFDTFEECVQALMEDEDIDRESAERICGSWEAAKDESTNHDMTEDTDSAGDESAETTEEQDTDRAPDDIGPADFAEFVASHYDGLDSADVTDALDEAGGDYVGEVDMGELAAFVADVVDQDTGTVQDAMEDLMSEENVTDDDEEDDDEDDENDAEEPDEEQESDEDERVAELEEQVKEQREILDELRAGGIDADDVDTPDPDDEQDADEPDDEQDADDDKHELTSKYQIK